MTIEQGGGELKSYVCEHCKGEFLEVDDQDARALAEYEENFGNVVGKEERVRVCDECYHKLMPLMQGII